MTTHRQQRVAELLQEELGILISSELTDPRLADALLNVTHVEVSQDLHNARVYVEHSTDPQNSHKILEALQHSETFLRKALVENLNMRVVPYLSFQIDDTVTRARRVDELLDAITHQVPPAENNEPDDTD